LGRGGNSAAFAATLRALLFCFPDLDQTGEPQDLDMVYDLLEVRLPGGLGVEHLLDIQNAIYPVYQALQFGGVADIVSLAELRVLSAPSLDQESAYIPRAARGQLGWCIRAGGPCRVNEGCSKPARIDNILRSGI
jgi:hypothetical protein